MRHAFPDTTEFYSTAEEREDVGPVRQRREVSLAALPGLVRRLADPKFDLVVVYPPANTPWSLRGIGRSLFRRSALSGNIPFFRMFGQQMLRGRVAAPIAVVDEDDPPVILRHHVYLLDKATLYFKRELPTDHWRVFMRTLHPRVPTPRFRSIQHNRGRIAKLRPISIGLRPEVLEDWKPEPLPPAEKKTDVFFAGRATNSSTVRERGLYELQALAGKGISVDVPDCPLPLDEYLARCARSWLVWCPEGLGWDCFRTYEVAFCGSVPLISRQSIELYRPFIDGMHAFYHEVEPGGLSRAVEAALTDRGRLTAMSEQAKAHVVEHHTLAASARYIAESTLAHAKKARPGSCDAAADIDGSGRN
jgi:glycosyltransferase involved in cell wall biosynthesis